MKDIMTTLVLIVIALGLTPNIVNMTVDAHYGNYATDSYTKAPNGTTKACTLTNVGSRFGSPTLGYITVVITNATNTYTIPVAGFAKPTWSVTTNSTPSTAAIVTLTGLTAGSDYTSILVSYYYPIGVAEQALIALLPLLWVVLILGIGIAVVYIEFKHLK